MITVTVIQAVMLAIISLTLIVVCALCIAIISDGKGK
jgi:hypothetical protein|nr:MAG TPA: hypothetical protein [Crassvirales sp.]